MQNTVLAPVNTNALDPKERSCCICLQPFGPIALTQGGSEAPVQLPCGHVFGEVCISSWILDNNSCPLCRKQVFSFGIGDHLTDHGLSDLLVSTPFSSIPSPQDDVWLDEYVWNDSYDRSQNTVSFNEIEALIDYYTSDRQDVSAGPRAEETLETLNCGEHHGFCQCSVNQNLRNEALPFRRLTTPAGATIKPMDIDNLDLVQLGSQFADLEFTDRDWMQELRNELDVGASSGFDHRAEDFFAVGTFARLGETVRYDRQ